MWDKIKAELAALFGSQNTNLIEGVKTAVVGEINSLKASLSTALAEIEKHKTALEAVKLDLSAKSTAFDQLNTSLTNLNTELSQACLAAKLEVPETATHSEKLFALQGAVNAAIAKTGLNVSKLPGGDSKGEAKKVNREAFKALTPFQAMSFVKAGGTITE